MRIAKWVVTTIVGVGFGVMTVCADDSILTSVSPTFTLNTKTAKLTGLSIVGETQLQSGSTTAFQCLLNCDDGTALDATDGVTWGFGGTPPAGTYFGLGQLRLGNTASPLTFDLNASYNGVYGQRYSTAPIIIDPTAKVSVTHTVEWLSGYSFRVNLTAAVLGVPAQSTLYYGWNWDESILDGLDDHDDATGASVSFVTNILGGTIQVGVIVGTSPNGHDTGIQSVSVTLDKPPVTGQPARYFASSELVRGKLRNSSGSGFVNDPARRANGLLIVTHGIQTDDPTWLCDMTAAIETKLPERSRPLPNVAWYDWGFDSMKTDEYEGSPHNDGLYGRAHGDALAGIIWKAANASPPQIDVSKPIHLIGHSAGGFVMGQCALTLKRLGITVDRITMLDTPAAFPNHLSELPNPGIVERFMSSSIEFWRGLGDPDVEQVSPDSVHYFLANISEEGSFWGVEYEYVPGWVLSTEHSYAHEWYQKTIDTDNGNGFSLSPFMDDSAIVSKALAAPAVTRLPSGGKQLSVTTAIVPTNFAAFGAVTTNAGTYTAVEEADAGLFADIAIPIDVDKLQFKYQFSGTNDGDFLDVRLGTNVALYCGLDLGVPAFMDADVNLRAYAGTTNPLIFTLVSRGTNGCVLQLKDIEIVTDDDVDDDRLTTVQELAAGTSVQRADTDGDGLNDGDEVLTLHTNPLLPDTDDDGMSDSVEVGAGYNPTNALSNLSVVSATLGTTNAVTLGWAGLPGRSYRVICSDAIGFESYDVVQTGLTGSVLRVSITNQPPGTAGSARKAYFRVVAE
jgi:hypothetical protein